MRLSHFVACLLFTLSLCTPADAATLYGATASGGPGQLHILDQATGASIQDIGALNDATGLNYGMTGLAFHPNTGVLYGSTHNNQNADPLTLARLVTIDPATAQVTVVGQYNAGNAGRPTTMTDLAFDSAGNLYGVGAVGGPQLYSIDTATGQATVIGNSGFTSTTGGGLAISSSGEFYGTPTSTRFGTYDAITGVYTDIANPAKPGGGGAYAALSFAPNGRLYGINSAPGSPPPTYLAIIDPATGGVTVLDPPNNGQSVNAMDAIAFQIPEPGSFVLTLGLAWLVLPALGRRRS
jgi:hypothetical protein